MGTQENTTSSMLNSKVIMEDSSRWPRSHRVEPLRVLSIQSHVSRDYVGNKAFSPLLQGVGVHVDEIFSVLYSSLFVHEGLRVTGNDAAKIINGLQLAIDYPTGGGYPGAPTTGLEVTDGCDLHAIVTGYITNPEFFNAVVEKIKLMKAKKHVFWLMDTVLGDMGKVYVNPELIPLMQKSIEFADCITPNHFELQLLAGVDTFPDGITSIDDFLKAVKIIRDRFTSHGPKLIICTSLPIDCKTLCTVFLDTEKNVCKWYTYKKRGDLFLAGTGDAFAACLTSFILQNVSKGESELCSIEDMILNTLCLTQAIIGITLETVDKGNTPGKWRSVNPIGAGVIEINSCLNYREEIMNGKTNENSSGYNEHGWWNYREIIKKSLDQRTL